MANLRGNDRGQGFPEIDPPRRMHGRIISRRRGARPFITEILEKALQPFIKDYNIVNYGIRCFERSSLLDDNSSVEEWEAWEKHRWIHHVEINTPTNDFCFEFTEYTTHLHHPIDDDTGT